MITRHKVAAAFAVAAVILGIGGGIAATHAMGSAARKPPRSRARRAARQSTCPSRAMCPTRPASSRRAD